MAHPTWFALVVALLGTAPVHSGSPARDFEFPKRMMWEFQFVHNKEGAGTGRGMIDWTSDSTRPHYWLEETYTGNSSFHVSRSRVSGKMGLYTYVYMTVDGTAGCLPAAFTSFPRKLFSKDTWTGSAMHQGRVCDRFVAFNPGFGAPGNLELVVCNEVPVMSVWTTVSPQGVAFQQRAYTTAFQDLTKSPVNMQEQLFETCTPLNAMRLLGETHEAPEVAPGGATESHEAAEVSPVGAQAVAQAGAVPVAVPAVSVEAHEAPERLAHPKGYDAHEPVEVRPVAQAAAPSLKSTIGGSVAQQPGAAIIQIAEAKAATPAANATPATPAAPATPPAAVVSKEQQLKDAYVALEKERADIQNWKESTKADVDRKMKALTGTNVQTEAAVKGAEEQKEAVERDAEAKTLQAEAAYEAKIAQIFSGVKGAARQQQLAAALAELRENKMRIQQWKAEMKTAADKRHDTAKKQHTQSGAAVRKLSAARELIEAETDAKLRAAEARFRRAIATLMIEELRTPVEKVQPSAAPAAFAYFTLFLTAGFVVLYARARAPRLSPRYTPL